MEIDLNLLVAIMGGIMMPVLGFLIKMIIDLGGLNVKVKHLEDYVEESKRRLDNIPDLSSKAEIFNVVIGNIKDEITDLRSRVNRLPSTSRYFNNNMDDNNDQRDGKRR